MVGVCYEPDTAIVFPWVGEFIAVFREAMRRPVMKAGHNFGFDMTAFLANGVALADPIVNTIETEALLRPPFKDSTKRRWRVPGSRYRCSCHRTGLPRIAST